MGLEFRVRFGVFLSKIRAEGGGEQGFGLRVLGCWVLEV